MGNAQNILIGAGQLFFGEKTEPNSAFSDVGYTRDGVIMERAGTFYDVNVDQEFSPVMTHMTTERFVIRTNLAEATLRNLKLAWGLSDTVTTSDFSDVDGVNYTGQSLQFGGPSLYDDLPEWSIIFQGKAPGTDKKRLARFHRCIAAEFGQVQHSKERETVIPASFICLADSTRATNKRVGMIFDQT